jgi:serine/threonine protein kinase
MNKRFCPMCRRSFGDLETCPGDGSHLNLLPTAYPQAGFRIDDKLVLGERIADGGMARIYRVNNTQDGRVLACKVLHPSLALQPYTVERFYRQARVSLKFEHPCLASVLQYGPAGEGHHIIVMELLAGESLASIMAREGRLEWERSVRVILHLCAALGYIHGQGVVHRDIKPENIQVGLHPDGGEKVWLLDFGIAQVSDDVAFTAAFGDVLGTPSYMSPEQIRGEKLDGRSDLYSLGIVLFEMLCGVRPFQGDDPVVVCRMQLYDKAPPLAQCLPRKAYVPPALRSVADELLVKSRSSRMASIGSLMGRLQSLLPGHAVAVPMPTPPIRRDVSSELHRMPTGEQVTGDLAKEVLLLHLQLSVSEGARNCHEILEVSELLASWRALVESNGAFVREPVPSTFQIMFGLFQPGSAVAFSVKALRLALELRDLIANYSSRTSESVVFTASIIPAVTGLPTSPYAQPHIIGVRDANIAAEIAGNAPAGAVVLDPRVADATQSLSISLNTYQHSGKLAAGLYQAILS